MHSVFEQIELLPLASKPLLGVIPLGTGNGMQLGALSIALICFGSICGRPFAEASMCYCDLLLSFDSHFSTHCRHCALPGLGRGLWGRRRGSAVHAPHASRLCAIG